MRDLFGASGRAAIVAIARRRALYAFDFDGTLAPIVDAPGDARPRASTDERMAALASRVPVALVSGRDAGDLRSRLAFAPAHVVGDHGADGLPAALVDAVAAESFAATVRGWLDAWPAIVARRGAIDGVVLEPKRRSLSVHYRRAVDRGAARRAIDAAVAALDPPPRTIDGLCVVNLLPPGAPDKGVALAALVAFERCDAAFFIGDDLTDETVFESAPPSWVTVRVGRNEASRARFVVDDQAAIDRCLDLLLDAVGRA